MKSFGTLLVEGWRFVPHSYAIVTQFQCQQFLQEPNLALRHRDLPYFSPRWPKTTGLFDAKFENAIHEIPGPVAGETPDAVLRISVPYNLSPSIGKRTVVFGTAEFRCVPDFYMAGNRSLADACRSSDALIVTPSQWSRDGFIHSGADPDRVFVVPHGIDVSIFHPLAPAERAALRPLGGEDQFVFLTLGAMTVNKGMGLLLKAFAVVAEKHAHARLILKGLGALYESRKFLQNEINLLTQAEINRIRPKMKFIDRVLSFADIAKLYHLADVYISPYSAEAFNMPVLEAIASGLPVICTRGGSTDDFTTDDFALRVNSARFAPRDIPGVNGFALRIDFNHLVHQMMVALESPRLAEKARTAGPAFVAAGHTWRHVTQKLLRVLFDADRFD
jgi:glycosyltransferase involved in cell wall biosynthesis